jgi:hypothetical protein
VSFWLTKYVCSIARRAASEPLGECRKLLWKRSAQSLPHCSGSIERLETKRASQELNHACQNIDQFVELMLPLGLVEVSRSGVVAISRGPEAM